MKTIKFMEVKNLNLLRDKEFNLMKTTLESVI